MASTIEYMFSTISPWAYMGHALLLDVAKKHNAEIKFIPVQLLDVFSETGGLPLPKRHPARQDYRWYEMQRWREVRKVDFNLKPKHWPFPFPVLDKTIIAAIELNQDPSNFIHEAMKGIWAKDQDLGSEATILEVAAATGISGPECLEKAKSDEIEAIYQQNTKDVIARKCFGSPTYWLNGEMYFGQDRLEQLDDALTTGRAPYGIPE